MMFLMPMNLVQKFYEFRYVFRMLMIFFLSGHD